MSVAAWDVLALVVLVCVSALALGATYRTLPPQTYGVDAPAWIVPPRHVYDIERASHDPAILLRWARGTVALQFPNPGGNLMATLTVARGPLGQSTVLVRRDHVVLPVSVTPQARVYALLLPASGDERSGITLVSEAQRLDGRNLGLAFEEFSIAGQGAIPGTIGLAVILAVTASYSVVRSLGSGSGRVFWTLLVVSTLALTWHALYGWHAGLSGVGGGVVTAQVLLILAAIRLWRTPAHLAGPIYALVANMAAFALLYALYPAHHQAIFAEDQLVENLTAAWAIAAAIVGAVVVYMAPRSERLAFATIPAIGVLGFLSEIGLGSHLFGWQMPVIYGVTVDGVQDFIAIIIAIVRDERDQVGAWIVLAALLVVGVGGLVLYGRSLWRHRHVLRAPGILPLTILFGVVTVIVVVVDAFDPRNRIGSWLVEETGELNAMVILCYIAVTAWGAKRNQVDIAVHPERSLGVSEQHSGFR